MSFSFLGVFGAGVLTFLSPCVLPLVPILTASLIAGDNSRGARLKSTAWFSLGFTIVFVLFGLSVPALTNSLGTAKPWLMGLGGVLFALFGLRMMGVLNTRAFAGMFGWMERTVQLPDLRRHVPRGLHGLVLGVIFAMGWTPCVGPVLGGVLTYVAARESTPLQGALLLAIFALGISLPLLLVAGLFETLSPWLARLRRQLPKIEYVAGLGLFVFGIYLASQARFVAPPVALNAEVDGAEVAALKVVDARGNLIELGATASGKTRMLFFYSETCPVCHAMERYLPAFEQSCGSGNFEFIRVNVGLEQNARAAEHFHVRAVPTVAVLDERGKEILHLVGYQTEARLRDAARSTTEFICQASTPQATCNAGPSC